MSYLSDYANNVSAILQRQGEQRASILAQRGQAQQQLIGGITNAVASIPGNIALLKDAEAKRAAMGQEAQLRGLQIQNAQGDLTAEAEKRRQSEVFNRILSMPLPKDQLLEKVRTEAPWAYEGLRKSYEESDLKAATTAQHLADAKAAQARADQAMASFVDDHLGIVAASGYSPAVFNRVLDQVESSPLGESFKPHIAAIREQMAKVPPAAQGEFIRQVVDSAITPDQKKKLEEAKGAQATATIQGQVAAGMQGGLTPEQQVVEKRERDRINAQQDQWEKSFKLQQQELGLRQATNTREQAKYDATYGAGVTENGQPIPVSAAAQAQAEYRVPPPSPRSTGYQARMNEILRVNPSYDATNYPSRQAMRTKYTSGEQGNTIVAMNTAIGHLDQLSTAMKNLNSGDAQAVNSAKNYLKTQFGSDSATNYEAIKTFLDGELAAIAKKGVASDAEIAHMRDLAKAASSPEQINGFINTAIPLIGSKLAALDYQYHQTMGEKDPFNALSPTSQAILSGRGFDPKHPDVKGGGGAEAPSALVSPNMPPPDFSGNWKWDGKQWVKK